ncbi:MAG TPA: hypothetical protein VIC27_01240 [Ktedonobacterales bacterium]|jgi:hypothetical protein
MASQNEERRASARRQRERQYEIDRLTAQYADEYRAGRVPRIEDYVQRHPDFIAELLEFAVYFHTIGAETEAPGDAASQLSTAAQQALTQIRQRRAATSAAPADVASAPVSAAAPLDGLAKQGMRAGYSPRALAEAVGLTTNLLGKLEARAIAAASIPPTLVRRLAATLTVAPESVASYLGLSPTPQVGAFYYADQPPTQQQEAFLDAVQGSALSPERKREWVEIAERDAASGA